MSLAPKTAEGSRDYRLSAAAVRAARTVRRGEGAAAAAAAGVSTSLLSDAVGLLRVAVPVVVEAVERGALSLHAASQIAAHPAEAQGALLDKVLAGLESGVPPARVVGPPSRPRSPSKRPVAFRVERALDQIEVGLEVARAALLEPEATDHQDERSEWRRALLGHLRALVEVMALLDPTPPRTRREQEEEMP